MLWEHILTELVKESHEHEDVGSLNVKEKNKQVVSDFMKYAKMHVGVNYILASCIVYSL